MNTNSKTSQIMGTLGGGVLLPDAFEKNLYWLVCLLLAALTFAT